MASDGDGNAVGAAGYRLATYGAFGQVSRYLGPMAFCSRLALGALVVFVVSHGSVVSAIAPFVVVTLTVH